MKTENKVKENIMDAKSNYVQMNNKFPNYILINNKNANNIELKTDDEIFYMKVLVSDKLKNDQFICLYNKLELLTLKL